MSGYGINDLSLSFKTLADKLNAKIILINRPGYGYSTDTNNEVTIDYIVEYYKSVLKHIGINKKVVLIPYSISGMYAMYWIEKYLDEIESMIALDVGSPQSFIEPNNRVTVFNKLNT